MTTMHHPHAHAHDGRGVRPLTPAQLAMLREQLEQQRRFRLEQLTELDRVFAGGADGNEVAQTLAAGARSALRDVTAAIARMDDGRYGACTGCGTALPIERLEVLPQVGECLSCRRAALDGAADGLRPAR